MSDRPDSIRRTPGYLLGRLHAYRDRGAGYVDGFRTSLQAGVLVAGVAFGAKFTESAEALWLGGAVTIGLECLKVAGGWLDNRFQVWQTQNLVVGVEVNPVQRWTLELLEAVAVAVRGGLAADVEWVRRRRAELGIDGRRAEQAEHRRRGDLRRRLDAARGVSLEKAVSRGPVGPPPRPNPVPK